MSYASGGDAEKNHQRLLHMAGGRESGERLGHCDPGSVPFPDPGEAKPALCSSGTAARNPIQLMTQLVKDGGGETCLMFWDLGSQVTLVTTQSAHEQKLTQLG
jgi:hypothetical protein